MIKLERILHFLDSLLNVAGFPDYPHALNGLQVQGPEAIEHMAVAVDASEVTILEAKKRGADLLVVHHGLFWGGLGPLTGPRYRKVAALLEGQTALYSVHLPLDAHADLGNSAILARKLGLEPAGGFGSFEGVDTGWWAEAAVPREVLEARLAEAVEGEARLIPGGPEEVKRVGIVTGGGSGALGEAVARGLDSLITGEAPHHMYHEAMELGVNLFLGGHYGTETFGVKAIGEVLEQEFALEWDFLDFPTGL